jgi:ferrous iron transport protein B
MNVNKIALVGNPNTGKTSLFNALTGLNQQVGNFPGVTVDKKVGKLKLQNRSIEIIDLPGTYSIYPRSKDEEVVYDILSNPKHPDFPNAICVIVDASNLERNLLLFTQIYALAIPTVLVLNMSDIAFRKGKKILIEKLQEEFPEATIIETNARIKSGVNQLIETLDTGNLVRHTSPKALIAKEDVLTQQQDTEKRFQEINFLNSEKIFKFDKRAESIFVSLAISFEIKDNYNLIVQKNYSIPFKNHVVFVALKNGMHNDQGYFFSSWNSDVTHVKDIYKEVQNFFL